MKLHLKLKQPHEAVEVKNIVQKNYDVKEI